MGLGKDSGAASSVTKSAISGIAGDKDARTGDAETGIKPIFDQRKVKDEINAQVAITAEFGRQASKAVGDYATSQLKRAQEAGDQAGIDAWKEGGVARVALHAAVGGLTGGVAGATGAATSQATVAVIGDAIKSADLPVELKQVLVAAAGTFAGAAAGASAAQ